MSHEVVGLSYLKPPIFEISWAFYFLIKYILVY